MVYNAALSRRVVRVRIPSGPQKEIQQQVSTLISSILIFSTKTWENCNGASYGFLLLGSSFSGLGCGFDRPVTMVRFHDTPQSEVVDNQRNVGKTRVRVPYGPQV